MRLLADVVDEGNQSPKTGVQKFWVRRREDGRRETPEGEEPPTPPSSVSGTYTASPHSCTDDISGLGGARVLTRKATHRTRTGHTHTRLVGRGTRPILTATRHTWTVHTRPTSPNTHGRTRKGARPLRWRVAGEAGEEGGFRPRARTCAFRPRGPTRRRGPDPPPRSCGRGVNGAGGSEVAAGAGRRRPQAAPVVGER